jgi:hypothetical protein
MHGPALVGWLLAAVCGGTGAYCLARIRGCGSAAHRRARGAEGLMGVGMAVMALPPPALPQPPPLSFAVVFAAGALWSLALLRAGAAHQGHHLLESLAMVYMALAMAGAGPGGDTGHAHGGDLGAAVAGQPPVTAMLLGYFAVYALRTGHRLLSAAGPRPGPQAVPPPDGAMGPEVAAACRLTLALGMFTMLLTL